MLIIPQNVNQFITDLDWATQAVNIYELIV